MSLFQFKCTFLYKVFFKTCLDLDRLLIQNDLNREKLRNAMVFIEEGLYIYH